LPHQWPQASATENPFLSLISLSPINYRSNPFSLSLFFSLSLSPRIHPPSSPPVLFAALFLSCRSLWRGFSLSRFRLYRLSSNPLSVAVDPSPLLPLSLLATCPLCTPYPSLEFCQTRSRRNLGSTLSSVTRHSAPSFKRTPWPFPLSGCCLFASCVESSLHFQTDKNRKFVY
jgi:hypothetical protein